MRSGWCHRIEAWKTGQRGEVARRDAEAQRLDHMSSSNTVEQACVFGTWLFALHSTESQHPPQFQWAQQHPCSQSS